MSESERNQAKYKALRTRCGETHVGTQSIAAFLTQSSHDPKPVKVERCTPPVLTDRCWQTHCEFSSGAGVTANQRANFYIEGEDVVAVDVL